MATFYVDPVSGNNSNAGSSFGAAWATTQKALTECNGGVVAEGDAVLLCATGVETITAEMATAIARTALFIGANSSGTVDGTRYQITTSTSITSLLNIQHGNYLFAFIDFDANASSTYSVDCDNVVVRTLWCKFHDAISSGWFQGVSGGQAAARHFASEFYDNGARGCVARGAILSDCSAYGNVAAGFISLTAATFTHCRSFKNGGAGFESTQGGVSGTQMWRCTADDNSLDGVEANFNNAVGLIAGCLFTRNAWAIDKFGTEAVGSFVLQNMYGTGALANSSGDTNLTLAIELFDRTGDPSYVDPDGSPVDLHYNSGTPTEDTAAPWRQYLGAGFENAGGSSGEPSFASIG